MRPLTILRTGLGFVDPSPRLYHRLLAAYTLSILLSTRAVADPPQYFPPDLQTEQWSLHNSGQTGGEPDADIDAPEAWTITTGSPNTVIAIIDSGIDIAPNGQIHRALVNRLWTNPGEIPANGVDDDQNGFVDDIHGWNFYGPLPGNSNLDDSFGHGTWMAGIAGAAHYESGLAGVCGDCRLMILKVAQAPKDFDALGINRAIAYAIDNGADVINLSLTTPIDDANRHSLIQQARSQGITAVAAMGNDDTDTPFYPAAYDEVIAVGASTDEDERWDPFGLPEFNPGSNYGSHIDLVAPGEDIYVGDLFGANETYTGTSVAAPHVAGVVALLRSKTCSATQDCWLKSTEIEEILKSTCDSNINPNTIFPPSIPHDYIGTGRLNAFKALTAVAFSDVSYYSWYRRYLMYAFQESLVEGFPDGTFRPSQSVTRAETLKLAYAAAAKSPTQSLDPQFLDVSTDDWFYGLVADASQRGFVEGVHCRFDSGIGQYIPDPASPFSCFFPNQPVTRAEASKIIGVLFGVGPSNYLSASNVPLQLLHNFTDVALTDWFYPYVFWMANSELRADQLPNGIETPQRLAEGFDGRVFRPTNLISRAEITKMSVNAMLYCRTGPQPHSCAQSGTSLSTTNTFTPSSVGNLHEYYLDPTNAHAPEAFKLPGGERQTVANPVSLTGEALDGDGDTLDYYWTADGGQFSVADPVHFRQVTWIPPSVSQGTLFTINVVRADGRGLVGRGTVYFLVPGPSSNSPPTGTITSPNGSQTATVTVAASVTDTDGLKRVYVTFLQDGTQLVLCGNGGPGACTGSSGSYSRTGINPASYGAAPGSVTLRLFVEDSMGTTQLANTHTFTYSPPGGGPTFLLRIQKQGDGQGTVAGGPINCGPGCNTASANIAEGTSLTLTGTASANSLFLGFMGNRCYGTAPCAVTINSDLTINASFTLPETLGVTFASPASGDTGVSVSSQIAINFNREILSGPAIGSVVFRSSSGLPVSFTSVVRTTDKRLWLIPSANLSPSQSYIVEIPAAAVTDTQGIALPTPYSLSFTTATTGAPKMYITAYPRKVMENANTKVSIWFETPTSQARTISLSSTPAGELIHPTQVTLPPGQVLLELQVGTRLNNGSTSPVTATLSASEAAAGQQSVIIEIANITSTTGNFLKFQAAGIVNDDDHDGIWEAGEDADIRFEVANFGSSTINSVQLTFSILNAFNMSILGGSPHTCSLGTMVPGASRNCTKTFQAREEVPTANYYIQVAGASSANSFLDNVNFHVVNNLLPDFELSAGSFTSNELQPGTTVDLRYTAWNTSDGFTSNLPTFEVTIEIDGTEHLLYRTYAEVRGDIWAQQSLRLPIIVPSSPGSHQIRAKINPPGVSQIAEGNSNNNSASEITLRVAGPNHPPSLNALGGPFTVNVGETLTLTGVASDPDHDPLSFQLGSGAPPGATINPSTGVVTWTPQCGQGPQVYQLEIVVVDNEQASDSAFVTIEVGLKADLGLSLVVNPPLALPGEVVNYTLVASSTGPSCISGVTVFDAFPPELTQVTWTCIPGTGANCISQGQGAVLNDQTVTLLPGASVTYRINARIANSAAGSVLDTASVMSPSSTLDPNGANNIASATVTIRDLDFGDAPDSSVGTTWAFPTRVEEDGARHGIEPALHLGTLLDSEMNGQPTIAADGDDLAAANDDDGVELLSPLTPCSSAQLAVTTSVPAILDAWIDFNADGDWLDAGEQVFVSQALHGGANQLNLAVPCSALDGGSVIGRFRLSSTGGLQPTGLATDGEVEDYTLLIPVVRFTLAAQRTGTGSGTIIASPTGILCGTDCSEEYPRNSVISLSAVPDLGSAFSGWTGTCSGTSLCVLTIDSPKSVSAAFTLQAYQVTVVKQGSGDGTVTSTPAGINCGTDCSEQITFGTTVTLIATPQPGSVFEGWSGTTCSGANDCILTVSGVTQVVAVFRSQIHTVAVSHLGNGGGTVSSSPSGLNCGTTCSAEFALGTAVTLSATPASGSIFQGWSAPPCEGAGTCAFTVEGDLMVEATFELEQHTFTVAIEGAGGTVESSDGTIACPPQCVATLPFGTILSCSATPEPGSEFLGWEDACTGLGSCNLTIEEPTLLTAHFTPECGDALEAGVGNWLAQPGSLDPGGTLPWTLASSASHSPTHAWFAADEGLIKDWLLSTKFEALLLPGPSLLGFWQRFDTPLSAAGGVLEYSTDGAITWHDILDGAPPSIPPNPARFLTNGYNHALGTCCSNPLPGRAAWTGFSDGWQRVLVDLSDFAGESLLLRWRFVSDSTPAGIGWWIDDASVLGGEQCLFRFLFADGFESGDFSAWSAVVP